MYDSKRDTEMLFALHLVHNGNITPLQFVEALSRQFTSRPKMGIMACQSGKLTMKQVFQILKRQTETGAPFGLVAVEINLLSPADVADLLHRQRQMTPSFVDCLKEMGAISDKMLEHASNEFLLIGPNLGDFPCPDDLVPGQTPDLDVSDTPTGSSC